MTAKLKLFVGLVAVLVVGVAWVTVSYLGQETTCSDLAGATGGRAVDHTLLIEVAGNTEQWGDSTSEFVREQLTSTLNRAPETPRIVKVVIEVNGATIVPRTTCLRNSLLLTASDSDIEAYRHGTPDAQRNIRLRLVKNRTTQIETIADAVRDEVRQRAFTTSPALSVLPLWQDAAETAGPVSILSPLVSTAGDCLQPTAGEAPSAQTLVRDCVAAKAMPTIEPERLHLENYPFLAVSAGQKAAAQEMIEALTTCGAPKGCG